MGNGLRYKESRALLGTFFLTGYFTGNWAAKIPVFLERLALSEAVFGFMILGFSVGGIIAMFSTSYILTKVDARLIIRGMGIMSSFLILLLTWAPMTLVASFVLGLSGFVLTSVDIAMKYSVVLVEKNSDIRIMSSCHGFWSLGGILGGATGGYVITALGIYPHAWLVTIVSLLTCAYIWNRLPSCAPNTEEKAPYHLPRNWSVYMIGIMSFLAVMPEGAVLDWGGIYLKQAFGASVTVAGAGFVALSIAMAVVRLCGDTLRKWLGSVKIVRISCLFGTLGMALAGIGSSIPMVILGFALAGIGIANLVPISVAAAGNQKGVTPSIGISTVGFMATMGLLGAPSILGFIGEHQGFGIVYLGISVLFLLLLFWAPHTKVADKASSV